MLKLGRHNLDTPVVCASVIAEDLDLMEKNVDRALERNADAIELRLDKLHDLSGWKRLLRPGVPTIVTNRAEREGGHFRGEEGERIGHLLEAIDEGVASVDVEFSTPKKHLSKILESARMSDTSVLVSHHNFDEVPPIEVLMETARSMARTRCDLVKLVGFAKESRDVLRILDFLLNAREEVDVPVISWAMGETGRFTRIAAPFFGSPFIYASADEKAAPGQFDVATIKDLLRKVTTPPGAPTKTTGE